MSSQHQQKNETTLIEIKNSIKEKIEYSCRRITIWCL